MATDFNLTPPQCCLYLSAVPMLLKKSLRKSDTPARLNYFFSSTVQDPIVRVKRKEFNNAVHLKI